MPVSSSNHKKRLYVALISIFSSCVILFIKWWAFISTGSSALKSDAMESVVNVVAGVFALGAIVYAEQPADREHPYGHGKIEYFSAAFEGGLISLAAVFIIYEAIQNFIVGTTVNNLDFGLMLNLGAGALNGFLGYFLILQGKKLRSEAIEADGKHILTDFYTTIGIVLGLLLVRFLGWSWIDPLIAFVVGVSLAVTGFKLVRKSSSALIDTQDPKQVQLLAEAIKNTRSVEIIAIHELRSMVSGRHTHVDMHIVVPEFLDIRTAHDMVEAFEQKVLAWAKIEGEVHSHIDPCYRSFCSQCKVGIMPGQAACPVRKENFVKDVEITPNEVTKPDKL